ncbi:MAG: amino acid ABC transporter permease [Eubacterium sp.]|nr:amino acid ABC transporter permease [Eubacterium sp.]
MAKFFGYLLQGITESAKGIPFTIGISLVAVVIGLIVGFLLAVMRSSKIGVVRTISRLYTDIVRGTPLVVQIFIFVYGVQVFLQGQGLNFKWPDPAIPATLACGLNSAAYMGEIIRGGLAAIDKGQREAAMSLGMTSRQSMRLVILPQAIRIILPAMGNEFVTLIKETAIVSYAGVRDIMRRGVLLSSRIFEPFPVYIGVAIVYLIFTIPLSKLVVTLEKRMKVEAD